MRPRRLVALALLATSWSCSRAPSPAPSLSPETPATPPVDAPAPASTVLLTPPPPPVLHPTCVRRPGTRRAPVLPPGLYFHAGRYLWQAHQRSWAQPAAAAVVGVYETVAEADRAARAVPVAARSPGYPWVVTLRELQPVDADRAGYAVVLGMFAARADADDWCAADPTTRVGSELIPLVGDRDYYVATRDETVTQIAPWTDAPAYAPEDLVPFYDYDDPRHAAYRRRSVERTVAGLHPLCRLAAATASPRPERACPEGSHWDFVGVECDGRPACVLRSDTLEDSVVEGLPGGGLKVFQVVSVDCDAATFAVRVYRGGRLQSERDWKPDPC